MGQALDYMIDFETGGLHAEYCPAFQIAVVKFSIEDKTIDGCFKASMQEDLPNRRWDKGTESFWLDRPDLYTQIISSAMPSRVAMEQAIDFICQDRATPYTRRFWAKPTTFDWLFFTSYLTQLDLPNPFNFRQVMDLNTYIRARGHWDLNEFWRGVEPIEGEEAHDALIDCLYQVRGAFAA